MFSSFNKMDVPRLHPGTFLRHRIFDIVLAVLLIAAVLAVLMLPARSQPANTIFLTDRNGQIPFPFLPPNRATGAAGSIDNMIIGATTPRAGTFTSVNTQGSGCTATPCLFQGLAAAQGGSIQAKGGTSSTSANAGGAASLLGGVPGATGIGGAASVTGGAGGSTSGAGGAASLVGGAGTAGNAAGGAAAVTGGAGQGSAAGGAAQVTGGVGGATGAGGAVGLVGGAGGATSGTGGVASLTGGAGSGGNANGGSVIIQGGAPNGSGVAGSVRQLGVGLRAQGAQATQDTAATLSAAQLLAGIIQSTPSGAINLTLPLQSAMDTAIPDAANNDSFDFSIINTSGGANTITVVPNSWTTVGVLTIAQNVSGRFRARKTGTGAWTLYRIS